MFKWLKVLDDECDHDYFVKGKRIGMNMCSPKYRLTEKEFKEWKED